MKKVYTILIILFSLTFIPQAEASHNLGGEITWRCSGTPGQSDYVFFMTIYIDCTGATWNYQNQTLKIFGSPLPRNSVTNAEINSITLLPDSVKWQQMNNGDMSQLCDPSGGQANLSCANGDPGTVQAFYYKSAPISMKGTPPASGWRFGWAAPCCRPNVRNLAGGTPPAMTLRAIMYPDRMNSSVEGCIDNSPEFREKPLSLACKKQLITYNNNAVDYDLDSLVYAWDRTYDTPLSNPTQRAYSAGFNYNNPTPDTQFDSRNVAATLDPISGVKKMAVYSGGQADQYLTVIRVDAYRDGAKIASVFREIPITFFDCPDLEQGPGGIGGVPNSPPKVFLNGVQRNEYVVNVTTGQELSVPIRIEDFDYGGASTTNGMQTVSVVPSGFMFADDFIDSNNCVIPGVEPCAILRNQSPTINTNLNPPARDIQGLGVVNTELFWPVECHHTKVTNTGTPGTHQQIYNFVLKTYDNFCPLPGINYPTITVKVRDPIALTEPIIKGASVDLSGRVIMQWAPPIDSAKSFKKYRVEYTRVNDSNPPVVWQNGTTINSYKHKHNLSLNFSSIFNIKADYSPDILNKQSRRDWYYRMFTSSGCTEDWETDASEQVQLIEVEAAPSGVLPAPRRSKVTLNWNRPKPLSAATYPYYVYESPTHFYIWENDSIEQGGQYIGGEADPNNWYLRGSTKDTTFDVNSNTCNGRIGFRVEARDTVVAYTQGNGLGAGNVLDTLTFSTFSVIDTVLMTNRGFVPSPEFDTIMVKENGEVYFKIDRANAGTVRKFKIFDDDNAQYPTNEIADLPVATQSFLYSGANTNHAIDSFLLKSFDRCDLSNSALSNLYTTISIYGSLESPRCSSLFSLQWNKPLGFTTPIKNYKVYVDSANTGFKLKEVLKGDSIRTVSLKVIGGVDYKFRVIAEDQSGAVNISAVSNYSAPSNLRTFELVSAPEIICANIESNGAVRITFNSPKDTTNNGVEYEFDYRTINGNWQTFSGSNQLNYGVDQEVLITGINAFQNDYEFRARTISGCDGATPSSYSSIFSTKGVNVLSRFVDYLYVEDSAATSYQWYDCTSNFSFPGEKNNRFTPLDTGYYGVYIEYADCRDTSFCYFVDALDTGAAQLNYNTVESAKENAYYQWYDCREDTLIPGANSRRFIATDTGYYAVILTAYGYKDTSECIPMFSVGLDEFNFENQLYVYPNPSSGLVNIELAEKQQSIQVKVRNIHGQLVQEKQFVNQGNLQLQLKGKPGIYFIELENEQGERANVKVVKR